MMPPFGISIVFGRLQWLDPSDPPHDDARAAVVYIVTLTPGPHVHVVAFRTHQL